MKSLMIRRSIFAIGASALIFAATACNPNRNNPNYNASQSQQPGATSSPGMAGSYDTSSGNTGSVTGAGDTSNTGASSSTGGSSESR